MIVKFFEWDQPKNIHCSLENVEAGDVLVIEHEWGGSLLAEVLVSQKSLEGEEPVGRASRKASSQDREMVLNNQKREKEILKEIKQEVREAELSMKVSEARLSLDGNCLIVAFVAEGRVDFRELVKNLSNRLQKTVRFQQIGSRDEARKIGGYGICGREVCCKKFPGCLKSISTEMARCQLVSHRGTERISGACGRLMCCLGYEANQYQEMLKDMPEKGERVIIEGKEGEVVELSPLLEEVKVKLSDGTVVKTKKDKIKKKS
ncbi:MAG: regulatory iron-sulfur-containing complex subunit RicT [Candidatus Moranbacteria bacterium]|nr:regulatory iron-sulfur-containing complex subunit RicT [Candidatus Moranbacteria bacterium]